MIKKAQGIIFDFNGVLLWDLELHEIAWFKISEQLRGYPFTQKEMEEKLHGRTNSAIFEYLLGRKIEGTELQKLADQKENIYRSLALEEKKKDNYHLSCGAEDLLDLLVQKNIPHTIATSSGKDNLDFFIEHLHLDRWFDVNNIIYDDGNIRGKPFPDAYLKAAEKLKLSPSECLVIEDAVSGIAAAHSAGIGQILAIGPKEKHAFLKSLKGVTAVISTLENILLE